MSAVGPRRLQLLAVLVLQIVGSTAGLAAAPSARAAQVPPAVAAGAIHSAALRSDGVVWTCGYAALGQLGRIPGPMTLGTLFMPVLVPAAWTSVQASFWSTYAIASDGTLWSWGSNTLGALGRTLGGGGAWTEVPGQIGTDSTWALVAPGSYSFSCLALKRDGSLWSWGDNTSGQLGLGYADAATHPVPTQVGTGADWLTAARGDAHALAIKKDGSLWSWG
jgi:hypothetical protein